MNLTVAWLAERYYDNVVGTDYPKIVLMGHWLYRQYAELMTWGVDRLQTGFPRSLTRFMDGVVAMDESLPENAVRILKQNGTSVVYLFEDGVPR